MPLVIIVCFCVWGGVAGEIVKFEWLLGHWTSRADLRTRNSQCRGMYALTLPTADVDSPRASNDKQN